MKLGTEIPYKYDIRRDSASFPKFGPMTAVLYIGRKLKLGVVVYIRCPFGIRFGAADVLATDFSAVQ
jgi:hypothetical protein